MVPPIEFFENIYFETHLRGAFQVGFKSHAMSNMPPRRTRQAPAAPTRTYKTSEKVRENNRKAKAAARKDPVNVAHEALGKLLKRHSDAAAAQKVIFVKRATIDKISSVLGLQYSLDNIVGMLRNIYKKAGLDGPKGQAVDLAKQNLAAKQAESAPPAPETPEPSNEPAQAGYETDGSTGEVNPESGRAKLTIDTIKDRTWEIPHQKDLSEVTDNTAQKFKNDKQLYQYVSILRNAMKYLNPKKTFTDSTPLDVWIKDAFPEAFSGASNKRVSYTQTIFKIMNDPPAGWPSAATGTRKNWLSAISKLFQLSPVGPVARLFTESRQEISQMVTAQKVQATEESSAKKKDAAIPVGQRYEDLVAQQNQKSRQILKSKDEEDWFKYLLLTHKVETPPLRGDERDVLLVKTQNVGFTIRKKHPRISFLARDTGIMNIAATSKKERPMKVQMGPITMKILKHIEDTFGRQTHFLGRRRQSGYIKQMLGVDSYSIRHAWVTHARLGWSYNEDQLADLAKQMGHSAETARTEYLYRGTSIDNKSPRVADPFAESSNAARAPVEKAPPRRSSRRSKKG